MALIGARAENIRQANPSIDRVSAWNQAYEESILGQGRVSNAVKVAMDALKAQLRVYSDNGDEAGIESTLKSMRELSNRLRGSAPARAPQAPKQAAPSGIPRIKNASEYGALKSGTVFIDPNGVKRRKP